MIRKRDRTPTEFNMNVDRGGVDKYTSDDNLK